MKKTQIKRLASVLSYDAESGALTWKISKGRAKAGNPAGTFHQSGYRQINVDKIRCLAQKAAWVIYYGKNPVGNISFFNGDKLDIRISNLYDMGTNNENLTAERLRYLLSYNPDDGEFRWNVPQGKMRVGDIAGSKSSRYSMITLDFNPYLSHRLVWLYVFGRWPKHGIDHIDRDNFNNRLTNLREADSSQNNCNKKHRKNSSGFQGANKSGTDRYRVRPSFRGVRVNCGTFATPEEAHKVYLEIRRKIQGEFARPE